MLRSAKKPFYVCIVSVCCPEVRVHKFHNAQIPHKRAQIKWRRVFTLSSNVKLNAPWDQYMTSIRMAKTAGKRDERHELKNESFFNLKDVASTIGRIFQKNINNESVKSRHLKSLMLKRNNQISCSTKHLTAKKNSRPSK